MCKEKIENIAKLAVLTGDLPRMKDDIWVDNDEILFESADLFGFVSGLIEIIIGESNVEVGIHSSGKNSGCYYIKI